MKHTTTIKQKRMNLDTLARLVKQGFDEVGESLHDLQHGQAETNKRLAVLEDGQGQIKLRLDNVAYRFEINELNQRVEVIEHKIGI